MRHKPAPVCRIARKPAADVVKQSAAVHMGERSRGLLHRRGVPCLPRIAEQKQQDVRHRKFGRGGEAAVLRIIGLGDGDCRLMQHRFLRRAGRQRLFCLISQIARGLFALRLRAAALIPPQRGDGGQQLHHARKPAPALFGKIGRGEKGLCFRRHQYGERPSALPGVCLADRHINTVDVRAFLTVYLDADKIPVQQCRNLVILKGFALHHMAPMTGRVADGEEDGLILRLRFFECLVVPPIPIHWVVGVLEKIGGLFFDQPVGRSFFFY